MQATQSGVAPKSLTALTVRTGWDQEVDHHVVVPVGGPVQRGRAIGLCNGDINTLREQGPDRSLVLALGRLDDAQVRRGGANAGRRQQDDDPAAQNTLGDGRHS